MCGAWRNIAALRVAFIELTIVNYLGLARAQLLINSMPYERYYIYIYIYAEVYS